MTRKSIPGNAAPRRRTLGDPKRRPPVSSTRDELLEIAADLMSRRGYVGTSISDIVAAAGVAAPALYWHFTNKRGVLAAVMERGAQSWFVGLPKWSETAGASAEERFRGAMVTAGAHIAQNPQFLRLLILLSLERGEDDAKIAISIREIRANVRAWIAGMIREAWPAVSEEFAARKAEQAMMAADGWCVMQLNEPELVGNTFLSWIADSIVLEAERWVTRQGDVRG